MRFEKRGEEKLKFTLCRTCAEMEEQGFCLHADEDRWLDGTWFSEEIRLALEMGYEIIRIREIYHWSVVKKDVFKPYIKTWLKIKIEASGWPKPDMTMEEKTAYIIDIELHEGIILNFDKIKYNECLRSLAKLKLNALWGKLGQQCNLVKATFVCDAHIIRQMATDPKIEIVGEYVIDTGGSLILHRMVDTKDCTPGNTSVSYASITTAYGRIMLYRLLSKIESTQEGRLLYFDTGKQSILIKLTVLF